MADSTKVRLVRCPKCQNLLPELADYSVYQCGGCGAVLRAKDKNQDNGSQKPDEAQFAGAATELHNSLEKGAVELSDSSDVDIKSNAGSLSCDEKNPEKNDLSDEDIKSNSGSLSSDEKNPDKNDASDAANSCRNQSKARSGKWIVENNVDVNVHRDRLGNSAETEYGNPNSEMQHPTRSWRSGQMSGWESRGRSELEGVMKTEVERIRFSTSNYPEAGPSNYSLESSYDYGEKLRNHDVHEDANRVQRLENDRSDLLRKLDELKEQLSRSCDVAERPNEKVPLNGRKAPSDSYAGSGSGTWFAAGSSVPDRASMLPFRADNAAKPPYFHYHPDSFPYINGHEVGMHNVHAMHKSSHIPEFGDPFGLNRAPHQLSGQYPSRQYFSRHYFDTHSDPFETYTSNANFHQSSSSCLHCYEKHVGVSAPVPPSAFSNKRIPDVLNNPMLFQQETPGAFGPHVHNSRSSVHPLDFHGPQSHARWPSDLNFEMAGSVRARPRRVVLASGGRCCHPMAGGAPFFTCFNCFEVLQVPKKILLMGKKQQKVQCGSCSTVINFDVVNKKLVLSVNPEVTQVPTEVFDSSTEIIKETSTSYSHGRMSRMHANFSSDDYDNSGYDFQTLDTDPVALLAAPGLNSRKHQETNSYHTSSLSTSEDENSPDALIGPREVVNSVHQPVKASLSPPPSGLPLQQHFGYSSNDNAVSRFGKGNRSSRSDQEKAMTNKATARQNSMKDASLATEIEVPFHEYSNTGVSQDSGDANREDSQLKISKGGESFFANIIKKSFKDLSRSNQTSDHSKCKVSVNGHLLSDRLVKKAEKLAGPIHPGQYWYDSRAGFWGVIGGHCLGIIPPFIEEFNYPMVEDCAGGNTSVYVNGRELHQKDLDLLSGRGLPMDRGRSYIIDISGRVLDEDTGEELDSLGKLAPTVEKVKHGFGMKIPKAAA